MTTPKTDFAVKDNELKMSRVFDAPRLLVFQTWTQCQHLMQWWGPREWPLATCKMDFREGGSWHYCMKGPDGTIACGKAFYQHILSPERFAYIDSFADENGDVNASLPSSHVTVEFAELSGATEVVSTARYDTPEALKTVMDMGMVEGYTETLDRLDEHLQRLSK